MSGKVHPPEISLQPKYLLKGKADNEGFFSGELQVDGRVYRDDGDLPGACFEARFERVMTGDQKTASVGKSPQ